MKNQGYYCYRYDRSSDGTIAVSTRSISNPFNQNVGLTRLKVTIQKNLLSLLSVHSTLSPEVKKTLPAPDVWLHKSCNGRLAFQSDLGTRKLLTQGTHAPDIAIIYPLSNHYPTIIQAFSAFYSRPHSLTYVATKHANLLEQNKVCT